MKLRVGNRFSAEQPLEVLFHLRQFVPMIVDGGLELQRAGHWIKDRCRKLVNIENVPARQCPQVKIIRIDMSVYFGSINYIQNRIARIVEREDTPAGPRSSVCHMRSTACSPMASPS